MAVTGRNELNAIAKFINNQLTTNTDWLALTPIPIFFENVVPVEIRLDSNPAAMFVQINTDDIRGGFGQRLMSSDVYEIKGIVEGTDFSKVESISNIIDTVFDWQNQIDISAGRPRCQETWTDPDDGTVLMIMTMLRNKPIKYNTFSREDAINYCHLGGEYLIEYYRVS